MKETGLYSAVNNYIGTISGQTAVVLTQDSLVHNFGGSLYGGASTGVFMSGGGAVYNSVYKGHRGSIYGANTGVLAEKWRSRSPTPLTSRASTTAFSCSPAVPS